MSKKPVSTKGVFTNLWGVRFSDEEAALIIEQARAKSVKPGTYIRQAAMETARLQQRSRVQ